MAQARLEPEGAFRIESVLGNSRAEACVKRQTALFSLALTIGGACAAVAARSWADAPSRPPPKAAAALSQVLSQAVGLPGPGAALKKGLLLSFVCMVGLQASAWATVYELPADGSAVFGADQRIKATYKDTLLDIARR
jgi:hypothetical protein